MKFLSNKRWIEVEINIETASKEEIMEAYSSVNEWAGCGRDPFPIWEWAAVTAAAVVISLIITNGLLP